MTAVSDVRRLYQYDREILETYLRALQRLPWKTAVKDRGVGHLSMKNTFVHILNVHDAWLNTVVPGKLERMDDETRRAESMQSWKEVRAYMVRVWEGIDVLLKGLTDRKLRRRVKAPWMPGEYTLADAFFQASIEQAHHLGELIAVFWQLDKEPPPMTWIQIQNRLRKRTRG